MPSEYRVVIIDAQAKHDNDFISWHALPFTQHVYQIHTVETDQDGNVTQWSQQHLDAPVEDGLASLRQQLKRQRFAMSKPPLTLSSLLQKNNVNIIPYEIQLPEWLTIPTGDFTEH